jgi:hypothetical protein
MMKIMFVGSNPSVRSGSAVAFWNDTKSRAVLDGWTDQLSTISPLSPTDRLR